MTFTQKHHTFFPHTLSFIYIQYGHIALYKYMRYCCAQFVHKHNKTYNNKSRNSKGNLFIASYFIMAQNVSDNYCVCIDQWCV